MTYLDDRVQRENFRDGNTRDELAESERELRKAYAERDRQLQAEDRAVRERLERASPDGARRNFVDWLNDGARHDAVISATSGFDAVSQITKIRERQQRHREDVTRHNREHGRYLLKAATEGIADLRESLNEPFNRRHPRADELTRADIHDAPSGYNFRPEDPGRRQDSRFGGWDEFAPRLRPGERVRDAGGSIDSDGETRLKLWARGVAERIEPSFLLDATKAILQAVRERSRRFEGRDV